MSSPTADADLVALESTRNELDALRKHFAEFAYAVSHDVAEPLAVVSGYARLLAKRYGTELDADGRQFVEAILNGVARTEGLVEDLRAFSRVGTRGGGFEPVSSAKAATEAATLLAVEKTDATVRIGSLPSVLADEGQLVQLFRALLSNALAFRSDDSPQIAITAERCGLLWVFSVSDNGVGVAQPDRERIFDMFQHGDPSTGSGKGAGLAFARRIVERHGGTIWVDPAGVRGSVFRFTLPASREDEE